MPAHVHKIVFGTDPGDPADYYRFDDMRGVLHPKSEQLEPFIRPGHDGETLRKTGERAPPSTVETLLYVADWTASRTAIAAYIALKDGEAYEVFKNSISYGHFRVFNVEEIGTVAVAQVAGSILNPGATVLQACRWTLISTVAPP